MRSVSLLLLLLFLIAPPAPADTLEHGITRVEYNGVDREYAQAMGAVLSAAHDTYAETFGFAMPDLVNLRVTVGPDQPSRLFTDGRDRVFLSLPGAGQLAPPVRSGTFIIYGLCHELGHVAMYRVLRDRDWMTSAAAEGWAHYAGSVAVDHVFEAEGAKVWPRAYNYRLDGTARLRRQLSAARKTGVVRCAGQWQRLTEIIGEKSMPALFEAWQQAGVDPADPAPALLDVLLKKHPDRNGDLRLWWRSAGPLFVQKREASDVKAESVDAKRLTGRPHALAFDDGTPEGRKSIAGGGHARAFDAPGEAAGRWYLTGVAFHGSRYGRNRDATFEIALCDAELRPIASWKQPYDSVKIGRMQWWSFDIPPTRVPAKFIVCLRFDPSATHGVYVGYDDSTRGGSQVGAPGKPGRPFNDGDWMIRVKVDQLKEADALND